MLRWRFVSSWHPLGAAPLPPIPLQLGWGLLSLSKGWILMLSLLAGAIHTHGNEPEPTKTCPSLILGSEDGVIFYSQMEVEVFRKGWLLWETTGFLKNPGERNLFCGSKFSTLILTTPPTNPKKIATVRKQTGPTFSH